MDAVGHKASHARQGADRSTPIGRCTVRHCAMATLLASLALLQGCAVITIAGAAASVAATAASTAIDVGVGAVRVTGKVIGAGVDVVTGPPAPPSAAPAARN